MGYLHQRKRKKKEKKEKSSNVWGKDVNTVPEAVPVWSPVRYISDTGQYRCTVLGLLLFYIYIYICMYVYMYVSVYIYIIINIKVYHKIFPQFRTNYSWF